MFNSIIKIAHNEFNKIKNSRITLFLYSVFPIVIFLCFSLIYKNEIIREIPIAIFDNDKSDLSRTIIQYFEASPSIKIVCYSHSSKQLKDLFLSGKIHGAVYIPYEFSKVIKSGKQSSVILFIDGSNLLISNSLLNDGAKILKTFNAGILLKKLKGLGISEQQAINIINPINIEVNTLYNPNYSYMTYLIPGLTTFILMMVITIGAVSIINHKIHEKEFQDELILTNNKILPLIIGKSIPHLLFHFSNVLILIGIIFPLSNITIKSSTITLIFYLFFFVVISFYFGMLLSSVIPKRTLATEVALFLFTPAFIYSGLTFPLWAMPEIHHNIAKFLPFTYFLSGFIKLYEMNANLLYLKREIIILMIFGFISIILTIISIRIRLKLRGNN